MYAFRKRPSRSFNYYALFWLIPLALVARVTVFVRQRSTAEFTSLDPNVLIDIYALSEIVLVALAVLTIFIAPRTKKAFTAVKSSSVKYLLLYYLICLISTSWSYFASFTLFRAGQMIVIISLIFICMIHYEDFFSAERAYLFISILLVSLGIAMHFRLGSSEISLSKLHTNQYSAMAAMAFVYCLGERWQADKTRKRTLTRLAIFFGCLTFLGTSATSNVAAFVGIFVVLTFMRRSKVEVLLGALVVLIGLYWTGQFEEFWMNVLFPGKSENDLITLRGRTYLWDNYMMLIAKKPFLGYGFSVVSRMGSYWGMISTTNTHNGFIEVLLTTGFLGGSFFLLWLIWLAREMVHALRKRKVGAIGCIGAVTVALINNLGRTIIGGSFDAPSTVFILLLAFFTIHVRVKAGENLPIKEEVPLHRPRKVLMGKKPRIITRTIHRNTHTYN